MRRRGSYDFLKFITFCFSFNTMQFSFPSVSFPLHAYFMDKFSTWQCCLEKRKKGQLKDFKGILTVFSDHVTVCYGIKYFPLHFKGFFNMWLISWKKRHGNYLSVFTLEESTLEFRAALLHKLFGIVVAYICFHMVWSILDILA